MEKETQVKKCCEWSLAEERQIVELRNKGMTYDQIAQTVGRTSEAVKVRITRVRAAERERNRRTADPAKGCYIIKMTDFETCKVTTFKEVVIAEHGTSSAAWDSAMRIIRKRNKMAAKDNVDKFYWLKYL